MDRSFERCADVKSGFIFYIYIIYIIFERGGSGDCSHLVRSLTHSLNRMLFRFVLPPNDENRNVCIFIGLLGVLRLRAGQRQAEGTKHDVNAIFSSFVS